MSILATIHEGRRNLPPRFLIYGIEGIGKSTLANDAPKPVFIPTEEGLDEIDCKSFPLAKDLTDVQAYIGSLIHEAHGHQTVVIDTADWLELLIWDSLCQAYGVDSIEKVDGGYSRGYKHALAPWRKILEGLDILRREKNMAVILLAHAKIEKFEDPEHSPYDRYSPRLHKHSNALVSEWSDGVLFATRKIITKTEDGGFNKSRTTAAGLGKDGGDRVLRCVGSPACVAKNRYNLPTEIPLIWNALTAAIVKGRKVKNHADAASN